MVVNKGDCEGVVPFFWGGWVDVNMTEKGNNLWVSIEECNRLLS